ncbi:MAG: adenylate/guanylate cyclase domain-containing protein [Spirochaetales bacterium]|nr:adenylate/guanylate cyclase domain-containing protein [Spirochaetales bacterium]
MHNALEAKLSALGEWSQNKEAILALGDFIRKADDWELFRINPYRLAREQNWDPEATLDLLIQAARVALFDFDYNLLCPRCGGVAHSHHQLDAIDHADFYCALCNAAAPATLDDQVEVSFTIHASVKPLKIDPLLDLQSYNRFHFTANYHVSPRLTELRREIMKALITLEGGESKRLELRAGKHHIYQLASIEHNTAVFIELRDANAPARSALDVRLTTQGFEPRQLNTATDSVQLIVTNQTRSKTGFIVVTPDLDRIMEIVRAEPTRIDPYLTARSLLNNQTFRDAFRIHHLSSNLNLNIKSLTILFTDLRGSTEMYDRAGDVYAYALVQRHFQILTEIVRRHHGAIIKTMGDAIMATFSSARDGILAALEMMSSISELNAQIRSDGYEIGLKVGLHEGPALAVVREEQLDYFGQTVNIAARVQGLALAGEIWASERVLKEDGLREQVEKAGYTTENRRARLKGVGEEAPVYRMHRS